jgi:FMN reductase
MIGSTNTFDVTVGTGDGPLVVGLGGTPRANSSTERALRHCLGAVERQDGRTNLYRGEDLDLPMYSPLELDPQVPTFAGAAGARHEIRTGARRLPRGMVLDSEDCSTSRIR